MIDDFPDYSILVIHPKTGAVEHEEGAEESGEATAIARRLKARHPDKEIRVRDEYEERLFLVLK